MRVLRAKYYPQGNLIDTVFAGNPSPTWSAIAHGLSLLKEGLIWRIGDGRKVRIWRDNWLLRKEALKVFTDRGRSRLIRVSSLIDDLGGWNEGLIRRTFLPINADAILRIKLSDRRPKDFLAWQHENNGIFTVRSAYRLGLWLTQHGSQWATSSAAPYGDKPVWKLIWSCKIPLKVQIFALKALSSGLATEANKKRMHIPVSGVCRICGHEREDVFHVLMKYPHAAALWAAMREVWNIPVWKGGGTGDWLEQWLFKLDASTCDRVLLIAWRIWFARNEVTHGKELPSIEGSRRFRQATPEQILKGKQSVARDKEHGMTAVSLGPNPLWTRPKEGALKLNIDGAYVMETGQAGAGMIMRRVDGSVV
jgi:hypothetical protein